MVRDSDPSRRLTLWGVRAVVLLIALPALPLTADSLGPDPWLDARLQGSTASAFRWDVRQLVTATRQRGVDVWDLDGQRHIASLWHYIEPIHRLLFSADEETLVAVARDGRVRRWDVTSWAARSGFRATLPDPSDADLSADGRFLAISGANGTVGLWDFAKRGERGRFLAHSAGVEGLDLSPDASRLLTCGADSLVKIWKLGAITGESSDWSLIPALLIQTGERELTGAYFLDDRSVMTYGSSGCRYWDSVTGAEKPPPDGMPGRLRNDG